MLWSSLVVTSRYDVLSENTLLATYVITSVVKNTTKTSSQLHVSSEFDGVECRECVMSDMPRRVTRPWGRSRGARLINTIWKWKWPIS